LAQRLTACLTQVTNIPGGHFVHRLDNGRQHVHELGCFLVRGFKIAFFQPERVILPALLQFQRLEPALLLGRGALLPDMSQFMA